MKICKSPDFFNLFQSMFIQQSNVNDVQRGSSLLLPGWLHFLNRELAEQVILVRVKYTSDTNLEKEQPGQEQLADAAHET